MKFSTWRRLWLALAEAEKDLGLDITDEQLEQMRTVSFKHPHEERIDIRVDLRGIFFHASHSLCKNACLWL